MQWDTWNAKRQVNLSSRTCQLQNVFGHHVLCIHTCGWSGLFTTVKNEGFFISTYHYSLCDPTWKHKIGMVIWTYDTFSAGSFYSCGFLICVYYCPLCSLISGEHKQMLSNKTLPWLMNVQWHIYSHNWSNKTNKNVVKEKNQSLWYTTVHGGYHGKVMGHSWEGSWGVNATHKPQPH
jgi:hypothetical protein